MQSDSEWNLCDVAGWRLPCFSFLREGTSAWLGSLSAGPFQQSFGSGLVALLVQY